MIAYSLYRPFPQRSLGVVDLLRFGLRKGGSDLWMIIVMGVLGGLLALVVPIATGLLFNRFIPASDGGGVVQVAVAMLLSVGAITAFQLTRSIAVARLGARMDLSLEAAVWDRLLGLPVPFFRDYSSGDLALRATSIERDAACAQRGRHHSSARRCVLRLQLRTALRLRRSLGAGGDRAAGGRTVTRFGDARGSGPRPPQGQRGPWSPDWPRVRDAQRHLEAARGRGRGEGVLGMGTVRAWSIWAAGRSGRCPGQRGVCRAAARGPAGDLPARRQRHGSHRRYVPRLQRCIDAGHHGGRAARNVAVGGRPDRSAVRAGQADPRHAARGR